MTDETTLPTDTAAKTADHQQSFLFDDLGVRGCYVQLRESWQELLSRREYPPAIQHHLGNAMAGLALLQSNLKSPTEISFQIQPRDMTTLEHSTSPLTLLVVQITADGGIRAMAKWAAGTLDLNDSSLPLQQLCPDALGAITLTPETGQAYQGMVSIAVDQISDAFEYYFTQSEQLPTRLQLTQTDKQLNGILFQRLPSGNAQTQLPEETLADHWQHVSVMASSLSDQELNELTLETALHRLFVDDEIRVFDPKPIHFSCRCSKPQMLSLLAQFDEQAIEEMLIDGDKVDVACEFCGNAQSYDKIDIIAARKHSPAFDDIAHNNAPETLQ